MISLDPHLQKHSLLRCRRQNKSFGQAFTKACGARGWPRKYCLQAVLWRVWEPFTNGRKVPSKRLPYYIGNFSTEICGFTLENLWTTISKIAPMWTRWTTRKVIQTYPHSFPSRFFFDFWAENGFSTNPQPLLLRLRVKSYISYLFM